MDLGSLPLNADGVPYVNAIAGDPFDLNLFAIDSSVTSIGFYAFGEPFGMSNPMTYMQGTTDNAFQTKVSLMWSPTSNEARAEPYMVVLRLMNGTFSMDYTIFVYVLENTSSIHGEELHEFDVFPNPSKGIVNINLNSSKANYLDLSVINIAGQTVYTEQLFLVEGDNTIPLNLSLKDGCYFVNFSRNSQPAYFTKKLIIQQE